MMTSATYDQRRARLQTYFDATAVKAWAQLTSEVKVSRIRETVRQGRDRMRATLLSWIPENLEGRRVFDAGCGTGALSVETAKRGAATVGVDIAANLVALAKDRAPKSLSEDLLSFHVGDMFAPEHGRFDHVVAMDSLIHYPAREMAEVLAAFAARTDRSIIFTIAPRTALLTVMHAVGQAFPRTDRSPAIEPVSAARLGRLLKADPRMAGWRIARTARITSGFYISQALELIRE
jgi:magnesium-protoporphyrin O-methyltransferase